jgi:hypothetical protein
MKSKRKNQGMFAGFKGAKPPCRSLWIFLCIIALAAGCDSGNDRCTVNADCRGGMLCDGTGKCVSASPLAITTESLPAAVAGGPYQAVLNGEGGLVPYRWGLEAASGKTLPAWLEVDPATGVLSGTVSDRAGTQWEVVGTLTDHSNGGVGETVRRTYVLLVKECEGNERCYTVSGKDCVEGERVCVDGVLGSCTAGTQVSTDMMHCGAEGMECGACDLRADNCAGECKCGGGKACGATQACCGGKCEDVGASVENCGGCGKKCDQESMHVVEATCVGGECGYNANKGCALGYYDCNGDAKDGCETQMNVKNCGGCGDDCTDASVYVHTSGVPCEEGVCAVAGHCDLGWADCQANAKGCETDLSSVNSCGACTSRCYADAQGVGGLCLGDAASGYRCGCVDGTNEGCTADRICCGGLCRARDAENCVGCDQACSISDGGLHCDLSTFSCDCNNNDALCKEPYPDFSRALCDSNKCVCTGTDNPAYSGTLEDMCCFSTGVGLVRVNLWSDANHCGICNAKCWNGTACDNGACECDFGQGKLCPTNSNAPDCHNGQCVCGTYNQNPCPPGQYCCLNKGCCMRTCALADAAKCSIQCLLNGNHWCLNGCCKVACDQNNNCPAGSEG